MAIELKKRYWK